MSDNHFRTYPGRSGLADVVLFMKGSPVFPQCGFSAATVQALTLLGVKFKGIRAARFRDCDGIKSLRIGRRSLSFTLRASLSAVAISFAV